LTQPLIGKKQSYTFNGHLSSLTIINVPGTLSTCSFLGYHKHLGWLMVVLLHGVYRYNPILAQST